MNRFRSLCYETLERRVVLASSVDAFSEHATSQPPELQSESLQPETLRRLLDVYRSGQTSQSTPAQNAGSRHAGSPPGTNIDLGDQVVAQFRVDVRDLQGRLVTDYEIGSEYVARVYVHDTGENRASNGGLQGVFRAVIDIEFSDNVKPLGNIQFPQSFQRLTHFEQLDGSTVRNIGAINRSFTGADSHEQLFAETSFIIESASEPIRIRAVPSTSDTESVLLYGLNVPLPLQNVGIGEFSIPAFTASSSPEPPATPTPTDPSPPVATNPNVPNTNVSFDLFAPTSHVGGETLRPLNEHRWTTSIRRDPVTPGDHPWFVQPDHKRAEPTNEPEINLLELALPNDTSESSFDPSQPMEDTVEERIERPIDHDSVGLFFDERFFHDGLHIDPVPSKFRLHFQTFSLDVRESAPSSDSLTQTDARDSSNDLIDIAEILHTQSRRQDRVRSALADVRSKEEENFFEQAALGLAMIFEADLQSRREMERVPPAERVSPGAQPPKADRADSVQ